MIANKLVSDVLAAARAEKTKWDKSGHEFRTCYRQPLGYHVYTVFDAATGLMYTLPYVSEIEQSSDANRLQEFIMQSAVTRVE